MLIEGRYDRFLGDESRIAGHAREIFFPATAEEAADMMRTMYAEWCPYTIQGAHTGISAAAVPSGGNVLNTERFAAIGPVEDGPAGKVLRAACGARLQDITQAAGAAGLCFRPNPTEETATIGGMFSCRAAGPNAFTYGDAPGSVQGIRLLLPDGTMWELERGQYIFDNTGCSLPGGGRFGLPMLEASAFRYGFSPCAGMDLIDLFAGSEGMLGLAAELTLILHPRPPHQWATVFFFKNTDDAMRFAQDALSGGWAETLRAAGCALTALEYLDSATLACIADFQPGNTALRELPDIPCAGGGAVLVELEGDDTGPMEDILMAALESFDARGGQEADTWAAMGEPEISRFRQLRHAAPEAINTLVDQNRLAEPSLHKLSVDVQLPQGQFAPMVAYCHAAFAKAGIPGAAFGHAASGRLHANLLPATKDGLNAAHRLLDALVQKSLSLGGGFTHENGVGKARRELLLRHAPREQLEAMRQVKHFFDPKGLLNPENML